MGINRGINPWVSTLPDPNLVPQFRGAWAAIPYEVADIVLYGNSAYICVERTAAGESPGVNNKWIKWIDGEAIPVTLKDIESSLDTLNQGVSNLTDTLQEAQDVIAETTAVKDTVLSNFNTLETDIRRISGIKALGRLPQAGDVKGIYRFNGKDYDWDGSAITGTSTIFANADQINNTSYAELETKGQSDGVQFIDGSRWVWSSTGVVDGGTIVPGKDGVWKREYVGYVDVEWFGVKTSNTPQQNTTLIQTILQKHKQIRITKLYPVETLRLTDAVHIMGTNRLNSGFIFTTTTTHAMQLDSDTVNEVLVYNMTLRGPGQIIAGSTSNGVYLNKETPGTQFDSALRFEKLNIEYFPGNGLYIGQNCREGLYSDIKISMNGGTGIFCAFGSDNRFEQVTCFHNKEYGIKETGGANYWNMCKAFLNGSKDRNVFSNIYIYSDRTTFVACESQESYGNGWEISGQNINCLGCVADSSGVEQFTEPTTPTTDGKIGLFTGQLKSSFLQFIFCDYRATTHNAPTQKVHFSLGNNTETTTLLASIKAPAMLSNVFNPDTHTVMVNGSWVSLPNFMPVNNSLNLNAKTKQLINITADGTPVPIILVAPSDDITFGTANNQLNIISPAISFGPSGRASFLNAPITGNVTTETATVLKQVVQFLHKVGLVNDTTT